MHTRRITRAINTLLLSGACSLIAVQAVAQQPAPDNTKVNKADRAKGAVTADRPERERRGSRAGEEDPAVGRRR